MIARLGHLVRRFTVCRRSQHRDVLDMRPWTFKPGAKNPPAIHRLGWRCVDGGRDEYVAHSDDLGSNRTVVR
jgi:hypothetical protein